VIQKLYSDRNFSLDPEGKIIPCKNKFTQGIIIPEKRLQAEAILSYTS
jgi:hypothetical protein